MPEAQINATVCVKLGIRDVHRATMVYLLNPRLLTLFGLILCAAIVSGVSAHNPTQIYSFVILTVFLFGLLPWIQAALGVRKAVMKHPFCHTFSLSGLSSDFYGGTISLEWRLIKKARETTRYLMIYGERGAPMLIPKAQLSAHELNSVREVVKVHLQGKAKLHNPD